MAGDFNLTFGSKLDAQGGNPTIKEKSFAKLIEIKNLMTYVIYREQEIQNLNSLLLHKNILHST